MSDPRETMRALEQRAPPSAAPVEGGLAGDEVQREKLVLLGRMASSLAHEMRNPLATIVATAQSLLAYWSLPSLAEEPEDSARVQRTTSAVAQLREDLQLVIDEARRAGELVGGLLSFSRQRAEWGVVAIADVVRRVVALVGHDFLVHGVDLVETAPDPRAPTAVLGNANQIQQVLLNLVVNSRQAIVASQRSGTVRIGIDPGPKGGDLTIVVEDDGPGVPEELWATVFEPFFTTKSDDGTGLGLYICRGIAQAHGGTMSLSAGADGGARFALTLPALAAAVARPVPLAPPPMERITQAVLVPEDDVSAAGPRVLLVDDEAGIRRVVARYLRKCGYQVEEAASGRAATRALREGEYAAVVSDLRMPGFNGFDLFRWIERERPDLVARVVFSSGDTHSGDTSEFLAGAGRPVLLKPFELEELVQVLVAVTDAGDPRINSEAVA